MRALLVAIVALSLLAVPMRAEDAAPYTFPEIGVSIQIPQTWSRDNQEAIDALNNEVHQRSPMSRFVYLAKFTRQPPSQGYPTFILIQKTPGHATSKELLQMFPKIRGKVDSEVSNAYSDIGATSHIEDPYLDENLGMIVLPLSIEVGAIKGVGRSYMIMMDQNIVSINVYASPENADAVFTEVEPILKSVQLDDNQKLKENWIDSLHNAMSH